MAIYNEASFPMVSGRAEGAKQRDRTDNDTEGSPRELQVYTSHRPLPSNTLIHMYVKPPSCPVSKTLCRSPNLISTTRVYVQPIRNHMKRCLSLKHMETYSLANQSRSSDIQIYIYGWMLSERQLGLESTCLRTVSRS